MKNKLVFTFTLILGMALPVASFSQGSMFLHFGAGFPQSDFKDDNHDDSGIAGTGLNLGLKYVMPLNQSGLGLFFGGDIMINGLQSDFKNDYEDEAEDADITWPYYINVPLTGGINYTLKANDKISFFGEAGVGPDFLYMTKWTEKYDEGESVTTAKLSTTFGFKIGGGLLINDKFTIGLHYFALGDHRIKFETQWEDEDSETFKLNRKISLVTLTFGFKL